MGILGTVGAGFRKVFGSRNDRLVARYRAQAEQISALETDTKGKFDDQFEAAVAKLPADLDDQALQVERQKIRVALSEDLRARTEALRQRARDGATEPELLPEAFAALREASRRAQNHRHFECQLIGGQVLSHSIIAEMKTGEGKTIVCHLAAYLKALLGQHVHIVTVNDYLVKRDAEFAMPIFELVGMTVGYIQSQVDPGGTEGVRRQAYACNLSYGTNSEFGFDYLRDNMKTTLSAQVQGPLNFTVVDEVDSILIDEARTPLIISGPADDDVTKYRTADAVARVLIAKQASAQKATAARIKEWGDKPPQQLAELPKFAEGLAKFKTDPTWVTEEEAEAIDHEMHYVVAKERKGASLTHDGITIAQEQLGVGSLYVGENMQWPHLVENAVRGHVVYEKDVDYVVQDGEVIIVDSFTGRLMHGRQWSDGLHQAVEAKESVKVKEETQTLATITLQNFFKLYGALSGMTGTAMTEADEFMKIYGLDVVAIPTNRPVNRQDCHDRIYKTVDDKYNSIVEEIHDIHTRGRPGDPYLLEPILKNLRPIILKNGQSADKIDAALAEFDGDNGTGKSMAAAYDDAMGDLGRGRPVLVGTISVENSEKLSNLLTRRYGIEHEVLNAKNHSREAEIVMKAGECHEAGRGKDKTSRGNVTIATNMAGRGTDIKLQKGVVYEKCIGDLGPPEGQGNGKYSWKEHGVIGTKCCITCPDYDAKTDCAHCWKPKVDPRFPAMGRNVCKLNVPCGLHIVGTERHESRRIDNQLRGRSGRQGDPGSSRFFLSLGDDLLRLFMGDWMLKMLERMGFEEGMAIEAKSINKGIERAQKKVEEKNFAIRKHLLEYDEVMDHQRKIFYAERQQILEAARPGLAGKLVEVIWRMIDSTVSTAAVKFLDKDYSARSISDWARSELDAQIETRHVDIHDAVSTERHIRAEAKDEARSQITMQVGEYMDHDLDPRQWDIRGLARWGEKRFDSKLTQNQLRSMSMEEVQTHLIEAAEERISNFDLGPIQRYMDPQYGRSVLLDWAMHKFGIALTLSDFEDDSDEELVRKLKESIRKAYREREVTYPIEWILDRTAEGETFDDAYTSDLVVQWVNLKFDAGWTVDDVQGKRVAEVSQSLYELNHSYSSNGKLEAEIEKAKSRTAGADPSKLAEWGRQRFGPSFDEEMFEEAEEPTEALLTFGRDLLRRELSALERYVLLQIYDQSWKEHMHAIDLLKESIGLRGYAEQDPKIAYKKEGSAMFQEMRDGIEDKVTSIIFKARLRGEAQTRNSYNIAAAQHNEATNLGFTGSADRDREAAMQAQGQQKVEQIVRDQPKVGRNQPCPCGSGKKFKVCCGKK